jgi:hypothetical protein
MTGPDEKGVYHVDEAYLWLEQGSSVMLKAVTEHGDPLELTAADARELAGALLQLAAELGEESGT